MTNTEHEFTEQLQGLLKEAYEEILAPYDMEEFVELLAAGRMLRSRLALATAGEPSTPLLEKCVALEMLHTSTLVHDDIIDKANMRRHYTTLSEGRGIEQALMIGNILSSHALLLASAALQRHFIMTIDRINIAQQTELHERFRLTKTIAQCIAVYSGKTSAMFELAIQVGHDTSPEHHTKPDKVIQAGHNLGIAFQLVDDAEDVESWLNRTIRNGRSKQAESDIDLGNYTTPTIFAAQLAAKRLKRGLGDTDLERISHDEWIQGITHTRDIATNYINKTSEDIQIAQEDVALNPLATRLGEWIAPLSKSLMGKSIDETLAVAHPAKRDTV